MKINEANFQHFTYFIVGLLFLSSALVYGISSILQMYNISLPWYVSVPSVPALYAIAFTMFDRKLWKIKLFQVLSGISSPNLEGKWKGHLKSSFDKFNKEYPMSINIEQTATSVKVRGTYTQSKSISLNAGFEPSEVDGCDTLFYFYRNEPNPDAEESMSIHEGSVKLVYDSSDDLLEGSYYSGRDRNNFGTIYLKRIKNGTK